MKPTPEQVVKAHQYLYYVKAEPIVSDYAYDMFCQRHGIDGHGGSDLPESYTDREKALAEAMRNTGSRMLS